MSHRYSYCDSPLGPLLLVSDGQALTRLSMTGQKHAPPVPVDCRRDDAWFAGTSAQLRAYFANELSRFDLPLAPAGTAFQRSVWSALLDIPFGRTENYGGLARLLGKPGAARAVGLANGRNPIGIIIPCHRVIGADGSLTGYGGGVERKRWLLEHESRAPRGQRRLF